MGKDIVEIVFGTLSSTFDWPSNTGGLLKCAAGCRPISIHSTDSRDQSRCSAILKRHRIKVKEIINDGAGFVVIVPERDRDRAHKILKKEL